MPALILNQGGRKIGFRLRGTATIGRRDQCDVPVISQSVSRHHATITMDAQGRCFVEDAGSRNGTFVNSMRIYTPRLLDEHDVILLGTAGNCSLTFLSGDTFPEGVQEASSLKPIPFACPVCGTALIAPPTMLGQARRCGGCSVRLLIPTKEGDVPAVVDDDKPAPPPAEPASSGDDLFDEAKSVDGYAEPPSIEGVSPIDAPAGRPPLDEYDPRVLLQALDRHDHGASAPPLEHAAPESSVHDANDDDQSLHLEGDHAVQALRDPASSDNGIREDAGEAGVIDNVEPDTDSRREHAPEQRERVLDSDAAPQQMHQSADEPHGSSVGEADIQPARALDLAQFTFKPDTIYDADDVPDDAPVSSEPSPTSELDDAQPASPDADADEHQVVVANPLTPDAPHLSSDAIDEPSR